MWDGVWRFSVMAGRGRKRRALTPPRFGYWECIGTDSETDACQTRSAGPLLLYFTFLP